VCDAAVVGVCSVEAEPKFRRLAAGVAARLSACDSDRPKISRPKILDHGLRVFGHESHAVFRREKTVRALNRSAVPFAIFTCPPLMVGLP
jgi:hypothetical protein